MATVGAPYPQGNSVTSVETFFDTDSPTPVDIDESSRSREQLKYDLVRVGCVA